MKNVIVNLAKEYGLQGKATLQCMAMDMPWDVKKDTWKRPALIVVPGGGYGIVSKREAEPVALPFLSKGYQTFILTYSVGGENGFSYPQQLLEAAAAVDYVKKHADEFNGLILLGAYSTADLSQTSLRVLSMYGSKDEVLNEKKYQKYLLLV